MRHIIYVCIGFFFLLLLIAVAWLVGTAASSIFKVSADVQLTISVFFWPFTVLCWLVGNLIFRGVKIV